MAMEVKFKGFKPDRLLKEHTLARLKHVLSMYKNLGAKARLLVERRSGGKSTAAEVYQCELVLESDVMPKVAINRIDVDRFDAVNGVASKARRALEKGQQRLRQLVPQKQQLVGL